MCGIIGVVGVPHAAQTIIKSLRRLTYRGYDSAGIVTCDQNQVHSLKRVGKIHVLHEALQNHLLPGTTGIGHTRWATHGKVTEDNAHPLSSSNSRYHVVCNGIIENYQEIRDRLNHQGYSFATQTDTEVIPLLLESYSKDLSLKDKILKLIQDIEGSYAFVIFDRQSPQELWAVRSGSPLLVAQNGSSSFLASDLPAILEHTQDVHFLNDGELVRITAHKIQLMDFSGEEIPLSLEKITVNFEEAQKEGYPHFMLKEIHEQPAVIDRTLKAYLSRGQIDFAQLIDSQVVDNLEEIIFVACGTAYHAGLYGQYLFESLGIRTRSLLASEFHLFPPPLNSRSVVIAVTQSGETIDTLYALRSAKERGAFTLAICNVQGSTIVREADQALMMQAGIEIGVASTKAYTAMLTVMGLLGPWLAKQKKILPAAFNWNLFIDEFKTLPEKMEKVLECYSDFKSLLEKFAHFNDYFYIARGFNFPTALEGALKLKELTYLHAEGYGAGEMKHGPIALVDDRLLTVAIAPADGLEKKMASNIEEIRSRGGYVFLITSENSPFKKDLAHWELKLPQVSRELTPLLSVIPLQALAYEVAVLRQCDPDQPRNLAKSVTVE